MAFDNTTTIIGNITADPELHFGATGTARCTFSIAWNQKRREGEDEVHYFRVTAWGDLAENTAESFRKGNRVWVYGRLNHSKWDTPNGEKRSAVEVSAEDAGLSVRWRPANVLETGSVGSRSAPQMPEPQVPDYEPF